MASDLSSGITGQALDVNCGEYKAVMATRPHRCRAPSRTCTPRPPRPCGLDDFGTDDDNYREALGVLLESYRRDADLTEFGSKMNRFFVRNALVARLMSEAAWKQYPQHADVPIERPIFVTGLPRTGTTALHRLLTADPAPSGPELWLAEFPQPRPPRETWSENPVFQQLDAQFAKAHNENPDYIGLHYMTADEVEECWQLLRQSLHSVSYETLAHLPTYSQWLAAAGLDASRISGTARTCS